MRTDAGARVLVDRMDKLQRSVQELSDGLGRATLQQEQFEKTVVRRINLRPKKTHIALSVGASLVAAGGVVLSIVWLLTSSAKAELRTDVATLRTEVRADIRELRDVVVKMATTPPPKQDERRRRRPSESTGGAP